MYTNSDPWGENGLQVESVVPIWVHATMCWFAALFFGLYTALDWFVNGFRPALIFWALFTAYYLWRAVVYTNDSPPSVE